MRGHGPKVLEAITSLQEKGELRRNLRPVEIYRRVVREIRSLGYADSEIPSRSAVSRALAQIGVDTR